MRRILLVIMLGLLTVACHAQTSDAFCIDTISDAVFARMQGKSFPHGCSVSRSSLRLVRVLHTDFHGNTARGEIVCHKSIAQDLLDIFRELYRQHYPIASIRLIDDFDADDERSMQANNTSCFCYRVVNGSKKLSAHARGLAIDLNPLQNPCVRRRKDGTIIIQPHTGKAYANRARTFKYKITHNDLAYQLFTRHGFRWGGDWRSVKDYQHFEKNQ
ncbi:MAG: M15 family metallopeptidase [Prevotella sp.]|nr:M15 family metallopeptidase [Prevotella sp.]